MPKYLLAIDQGTTSSRAIVFSDDGAVVAIAQEEFTQHFPEDGWVEHNPEEIWDTSLKTCREAIAKAGLSASDISGIGITNQRETTVVWDRATGKAVYPAIVWQDRRTADWCRENKHAEGLVTVKTGLLLDPYFSATKIAWILDNVDGARERANKGELAFGTIDSFLLWRLTGGKSHATDATNASRTMLFDIQHQHWDPELLQLFNVPENMLPEVKDCAADFGSTDPELLGAAIPVAGMAGDQQAALIGQACFEPGMIKSTYGTGCFMVLNTGNNVLRSKNKLLSTVAYRLNGKTTYAIEGSIFIAGAAVQWLRDAAKMVNHASETEAIAQSIEDTGGVYLVPAFTGLGAPHWEPDARGALIGLTRDSGIAEISRATLESVCYQTRDLLEAMRSDGSPAASTLRVDGGMVANDWLVQFLADMLDTPIDRPRITETTAFGAACLAGLQLGIYASVEDIAAKWQCETHIAPSMDAQRRERLYSGWQDALRKTLA